MGAVPTFLVEHAELVPLALVLVVAGCAALALLVRRRRTAGWLLALTLVPVLVLTLAPDDRGRRADGAAWCEVGFSVPTPGSVELLANVALFVPPAVFAVLLVRRPVLVALGGSASSVVVEAVQAAAPALGRSCTTDDWAMNTLGTLVGVVVGVLVAGRVGAAVRRLGRIPARG
ncbi:VanZ family protein [Kineococcus sp. SYSU DK003]|uniref:VanZ family protein n=1 Tax=Kineococcus sp. SYSU DK003 TaxID=3383124 RepID=UPI003D7EDA7D